MSLLDDIRKAADAMEAAADDVVRASNTLMLMLTGDLNMTKLSLEAALRRALDARNKLGHAKVGYRAAIGDV